jgi:hypothetical protein
MTVVARRHACTDALSRSPYYPLAVTDFLKCRENDPNRSRRRLTPYSPTFRLPFVCLDSWVASTMSTPGQSSIGGRRYNLKSSRLPRLADGRIICARRAPLNGTRRTHRSPVGRGGSGPTKVRRIVRRRTRPALRERRRSTSRYPPSSSGSVINLSAQGPLDHCRMQHGCIVYRPQFHRNPLFRRPCERARTPVGTLLGHLRPKAYFPAQVGYIADGKWIDPVGRIGSCLGPESHRVLYLSGVWGQ